MNFDFGYRNGESTCKQSIAFNIKDISQKQGLLSGLPSVIGRSSYPLFQRLPKVTNSSKLNRKSIIL